MYMFLYLHVCQKRASDTIIDTCEPLCGCPELNSGMLEELSDAKLSLQLPGLLLLIKYLNLGMVIHVCNPCT